MKLSPLTIIIVGICLMLPMLSLGFFMYWSPNMAEKKMYEDNLALQEAEIAKKPQAEKRVKQAYKMVADATAGWSNVVAVHTPPKGVENGGIDLAVNPAQLSVDTHKFRNSVQRALNKQLKAGGVVVVNGPYVNDYPYDGPVNSILSTYYNYPTPIPFPVVIYDLGTVTVQGTYKQIFDNMRAWSRMPRYLAVADGLRLDGTSPNLTGTYNLTLVGFIRAKTIAPAISEGVAAASTGGAGGGFPGGFGGFGGPRGPGGIPGAPGGGGPPGTMSGSLGGNAGK